MAVDNLKIAQEMVKLLEMQNKLLEQQKALMKDQTTIAQDVNKALGQSNPEDLADRINKIRGPLGEINTSAKGLGDTFSKTFTDGIKEKFEPVISWFSKIKTATLDYFKLLVKSPGYFVSALMGDLVVKSFNFIKNSLKSLKYFTTEAVFGLFNIGKALLSIPGRIFVGLLEDADAFARETMHIAEAWERVREKFGDFKEDITKNIREAVDAAQGFSAGGRAAEAGLSMYQMFQDAAGAADWMSEMFGALGTQASVFGKEIAKMGVEKFATIVKGMGLTGEMLKGMSSLAIANGKTLESQLKSSAKVALGLAAKYGVSSKSVMQDVAGMTENVTDFGNTSQVELASSAVWMRKLGLEAKSLGKIVNKFLTFEDAAENASKLSQAFGMNLDTLTLMNGAANGGASSLDHLRKQFMATGRDVTKMNTAELRLLAQTTGLSEEEARLAFSLKNRGKSLEQIRKEGKAAGLIQKTEAEIMQELADNVARVVRFFEMSGNLINRFFQGFAHGLKLTKEYTHLMKILREVSMSVFTAGMRVANLFVAKFPGVQKIFKGLYGMFEPKVYEEMMGKVKGLFENFFEELSTSPKTAIKNLLMGLRDAFTAKENSKEVKDGYQAFIEGLRDFFLNGIVGTFTGTVSFLGTYIPKLFSQMGDLISGRVSFETLMSDMFGMSGKTSPEVAMLTEAIKTAYERIKTSLKENWEPIKESFKVLMVDLWEAGKAKLKEGLGNFNEFLITSLGGTVGIGDALLGDRDSISTTLSLLMLSAEKWFVSNQGDIKKKLSPIMLSIFKGLGKVALTGLGIAIRQGVPFMLTSIKNQLLLPVSLPAMLGNYIRDMLASELKSAWQTFKELFDISAAFESWKPILDTAVKWWSDTFASIKEKISKFSNDMLTDGKMLGKNLLEGLGKSLKDLEKDYPIIKSLLGMFDAVREKLDIHSPSRMTERTIGAPLAQGMMNGISNTLQGLPDTVTNSMNFADVEKRLTNNMAALGALTNSAFYDTLSAGTYDALTDTVLGPAKIVEKMAADVQAIHDAMLAPAVVDASLRLERLGKELGLKNGKITVDAKPIEVTLNLQVVMEADKLSSVLLETGKIMPKPKA